MLARQPTAPTRRPPRTARPALEPLEPTLALAAPAHSAGNDSDEVHARALTNEMRKNPAAFGATITKVYKELMTGTNQTATIAPRWF